MSRRNDTVRLPGGWFADPESSYYEVRGSIVAHWVVALKLALREPNLDSLTA